jgi:hypothetical protein
MLKTQIQDLYGLLGALAGLGGFKFKRIPFSDKRNSSFSRNPLNRLSKLDKDLASQYLGYKFGFESLYQATVQALGLPDKLTKKINYLLRKVGKPTTGRVRRVLETPRPTEPPALVANLPDLFEVEGLEAFPQTIQLEHRLVVNQTLRFPEIKQPGFQLSKFLKLVGLQPSVKDLYDLIPYTWLLDWFSDLGRYIGAISALASTDCFISYGFMTTVCDQTVLYQPTISVTNSTTTIHFDGSEETQEDIVRYPCYLEFTSNTHHRVRATSLNGVRNTDSFSNGWSDFQLSILYSLFTQKV